MKKTLLVSALALALTAPASAIEVDEILKNYAEAKGGMENIEKIQTVKVTGTMNMGPMEAPLSFEWAAPNKIRMEFKVQNMVGVMAYDGEMGWQHMPFMGATEPAKMNDEELSQVMDQTDLFGPLINSADKGHTIELLGEEEIQGAPCYKLKVTKKSGDVDVYYLDQEYFLEIRSDSTRKMGEQEIEAQTSYGDYKEIGGVMFAHSIESKASGMPEGMGGQMITFEKIEVNVDIANDRFVMPEPAEAATGE